MLALKKALLSATLCVALTAPTQASNSTLNQNDDDNDATFNTASAAPVAPWDIEVSNAAKLANKDTSLMSLNRGTLIEVCKILAENDAAESIIALGQTSIHMAGRILKPVGEYAELFQDEFTRINNPDMRQAIRVELRKVINARAEELATLQKELEDQPKPKARLLAPWKELLGEKAPLQHLIWANDMLSPDNVERLGKKGLLEQLAKMEDKEKALALGASATEIFTENMNGLTQALIIKAAHKSATPLSEYAALGAACRDHLFTEWMSGHTQALIIQAVFESCRPLSECAALGAACRTHLLMGKMNDWEQPSIFDAALKSSRPLSEYAALGAACKRLFTETMGVWDQARIIRAALKCSRPLSEMATLGIACKQYLFTEQILASEKALIIQAALESSHPFSEYGALSAACANLFTEDMNGMNQACLIKAVFESSRPLSTYATFAATCREYFFTRDMDEGQKGRIIRAVLPLSDAQIAQLATICAARPWDDMYGRYHLIQYGFIEGRLIEDRPSPTSIMTQVRNYLFGWVQSITQYIWSRTAHDQSH